MILDIPYPPSQLIFSPGAHCKYGGHELYNEQSEYDTCKACILVAQLSMSLDWHMLDIYFKEYKRDLKGLLPGFLNENPFEQDYYDTHLHHDRDLHSFDFNSMMKDMYSSGMKRSDFSKWNPGDWTCGNCTVKFMENHIHLWFTAQKRKGITGVSNIRSRRADSSPSIYSWRENPSFGLLVRLVILGRRG